MKIFHGITARAGIAAALVCGFACAAGAADIKRSASPNLDLAIAEAGAVPLPGVTVAGLATGPVEIEFVAVKKN